MKSSSAVINTSPWISLPTFDLTDPEKDRRYEGNYSNFIYNGDYRITFYARNENGNVTVSSATIISVTGGQDVAPTEPGDVNGDKNVTLADAILALKIACGVDVSGETISLSADVNEDGKIGLAEVIYIMQRVAGLRD